MLLLYHKIKIKFHQSLIVLIGYYLIHFLKNEYYKAHKSTQIKFH
ncbi:hypothetical protein P262_04465 [Cronobacter malonaticus]|uniref:Uncharacterized protein n=1 Tax=Cronobacter malonaticus TaxID=413503 RepID=V5U2D6_9ENTR|nr:hypothetical protein P262_04465 [Cronobacter malonaticus]